MEFHERLLLLTIAIPNLESLHLSLKYCLTTTAIYMQSGLVIIQYKACKIQSLFFCICHKPCPHRITLRFHIIYYILFGSCVYTIRFMCQNASNLYNSVIQTHSFALTNPKNQFLSRTTSNSLSAIRTSQSKNK